MITLIHGDNIEASRKEFNRLKESMKGREIRTLDGKNLDDGMLIQAVESSSLFSGNTLVVIEYLFGKIGKQTKRIAAYASILNNVQDTDIILWEDKELGPSIVKQLKGITNRLFAVPPQIFVFLDGIRPGNARILLPLYQSLITEEAPELVFAMLVKRIRFLIQLQDNQIPSGMSPWQINRLTTQSKSFTMEQLIALYTKLHNNEILLRTGNSPFTSSQHVELLIAGL
jgi:hypothetical protein